MKNFTSPKNFRKKLQVQKILKIFTSPEFKNFLSPKKNNNKILKKGRSNLPITGSVSTDRSMEAALLITTPGPANKSYTSDFASQH